MKSWIWVAAMMMGIGCGMGWADGVEVGKGTTMPAIFNEAAGLPAAGATLRRVEINSKGEEMAGTEAADEMINDAGKVNTKGFEGMGFPAVMIHENIGNATNSYHGEGKARDGGKVGWWWTVIQMDPQPAKGVERWTVSWEKDGVMRRWVVTVAKEKAGGAR